MRSWKTLFLLFIGVPLLAVKVPIRRPNRGPDDALWKRKVVEKSLEVKRRMLPYWRLYNPLDIPTLREIGDNARIMQNDTVVIRILAIRVEFVEEDPDDPRTTGNGKMRLTSNDEPIFDTTACRDSVYNMYYDPPHDKKYFERLMEAYSNYINLATFGKVRVEWVVKPDDDTLSYQLPHPMVYYGDPDNYDYGLVYLVRDAFKAADEDSTIDFDDLDGNGIRDPQEGVLDRYVVFHAGSAWQTDIMNDTPYDIAAVTVMPGNFMYYLGYPYVLANDGTDTLWGASVMPEEMSQDGVESRLQGVLFHENMHNLFYFPDLYDTYGHGAGIGAWGIMATGPYVGIPGSIPEGLIPPLPNAWERTWIDWILRYIWGDYAGFLNDSILVTLEPGSLPESLTVKPSSILTDSLLRFLEDPYSAPRFYKVPINGHEYFLIENKLDDLPQNDSVFCDDDTVYIYGEWKDGVFVHFYGENDYLLPGKGLLIWHVDEDILWNNYSYNTCNAVRPMAVDLLEADHVQDLEKWTDFSPYLYAWFGCPYDAYFEGNNTLACDTTMPSTRDNYGGETGLTFFEISAPGTLMTFKVKREQVQAGFPQRLGYSYVKIEFGTFEFDITHEPAALFAQPFDGGVAVLENVIVDTVRFDYITGEEDTVAIDTLMEVHIIGSDGRYLFGDTIRNRGLFLGGPLVVDLNSDDTLELLAGSTEGKLYAWSMKFYSPDSAELTAFPGFPISMPDQLRAALSAADLNGDGLKEILVPCEDQKLHAVRSDGTEYFEVEVGAPGRTTPALTDSLIYYLSADGRLFLISPSGEVLTTVGEPYVIESTGSPAVGDIDRDGSMEVLVPRSSGSLACYDVNGEEEWTRQTRKGAVSSAAIGDVDDDGFGEVFFVSANYLYGFNHTGSLLSGYPIELAPDTVLVSAPVLGDVNGDGKIEVVLSVSGRGVLAFDSEGRRVEFEKNFPGGAQYPPAFSDLDGDGDIELIAGDSTGFLSAWDLNSTRAEWISFGNGPQHTSCWSPAGNAPSTENEFSVRRIYLYPNPTYSGVSWLRFRASRPSALHVGVYTFAGERVAQFDFLAQGGDFEDKELDLSDLPSGVYFIRVKFERENKPHILKLAITR